MGIREEPEAESEERETVEQFSLEQGMSASPMANYHAHPPELSASPSPAQTQSQPKYRPQSASVVFHDNIRDSQIYDNGVHDEDDEEDEDSRSGHEYESESDHAGYGVHH